MDLGAGTGIAVIALWRLIVMRRVNRASGEILARSDNGPGFTMQAINYRDRCIAVARDFKT